MKITEVAGGDFSAHSTLRQVLVDELAERISDLRETADWFGRLAAEARAYGVDCASTLALNAEELSSIASVVDEVRWEILDLPAASLAHLDFERKVTETVGPQRVYGRG